MKVGTKSVLYGAHAFWLHPWFVAWAWTKLFGFPFDPRLWVAFFVHDLGYWGCPNMDGEEGERHPIWGANVMYSWFDVCQCCTPFHRLVSRLCNRVWGENPQDYMWTDFTEYHSRFLAKKVGATPSRLCIADKLSIALTPTWLYLPMVIATGEIREYVKLASDRRPDERSGLSGTEKAIAKCTGFARLKLYWKWHRELHGYMRDWVEEHRDGREDTWTPDTRKARGENGVWE